MSISNRKEALVLFVGGCDTPYCRPMAHTARTVRRASRRNAFCRAYRAVWHTLFGMGGELFIAGLYEKHTLLLKSRLPNILLNTQIINSVIAVLFFYFIPYFVIAPKTNLFIYLVISSVLILGWRIFGVPAFGFRKKAKSHFDREREEMRELRDEVNGNPRYSLVFFSSVDLSELSGIDFEKEVLNTIYSESISTVVIDLKDERAEPILPRLYNLIFSGVRFVDKYKVYEDILTVYRFRLSGIIGF